MNIDRNIDEIDESYKRRKWFVEQINPKTEKERIESIKLSNMWVNTLFLGCVYFSADMNKIKKILINSNFTNN